MAKLVFLLISSVLLGSAMADGDYFKSIDGFSGQFYKSAVNQPKLKDKNVVLSALSVNQVLSMVAFGAQDETKQEILNALQIKDLESSIPSIRETVEELNKPKGVILNLANNVYTRLATNGKLDSIATTYKSTIENVFKSEIKQVDFSKSVQTAAEINKWVEDHTNNRIKDLISADSIDSQTVAVLVNAIYFKGLWAKKFDISQTREEDFTRNDGTVVKVPMMNKIADFKFKNSKELDSKILVLPYEKEEVVLVLVLPNKKNDLDAVEGKLSDGILQHLEHAYEYEITVKLPRFKIETTCDVKKVLQDMGVKRIFDPQHSQLRGILDEPTDLVVSEAIQKAFIEVNEEGAEAAAATEFVETNRSARVRLFVDFIANRPFYFEVRSLANSVTLFSGSFRGPQ